MPVDALTSRTTPETPRAQLVLGGSWVWRHSPAAETFDRVLDAARDKGISWLDTSPAYGACVELTRRWRQRHGNWFSTVVKLPVTEPETWQPHTFMAAAQDACHALGIPVAPILLLHGPPQHLFANGSTWWSKALDALCAMRDGGLAERVGVAAELSAASAALDSRLDVIQVPINLADTSALHTLLPAATDLGVEVMAARALANCVWMSPEHSFSPYTAEYATRWRRRTNLPPAPPPLEAAIRFIAHAGPRWVIFSTSQPKHVREVATLATHGPLGICQGG